MTADKNSTDDNNVDKIDSDDNSTDKVDTDDAQEVGTGKTRAEKVDAAASDDVPERQAPRTKSARAAARRSSAAADGTPQETAAQKTEG